MLFMSRFPVVGMEGPGGEHSPWAEKSKELVASPGCSVLRGTWSHPENTLGIKEYGTGWKRILVTLVLAAGEVQLRPEGPKFCSAFFRCSGTTPFLDEKHSYPQCGSVQPHRGRGRARSTPDVFPRDVAVGPGPCGVRGQFPREGSWGPQDSFSLWDGTSSVTEVPLR